ncbi:MAG TPA: hypothetical protein PKY56_00335 [Candidatus Kapabacteria bacterium]|nr:hypothetical protein [Candidatus Kapabacteria bacterium]HPO61953.1 hypothetical protein [Candidatus Kapabacteria bacterium]
MLKRNSHIKKITYKTYLFISNLIWNFLFLFKKNSSNNIYLKSFSSKFKLLFEKPYTLILSNDCGGGSESYLNVLIEENKFNTFILKYNLKKGYFHFYYERSYCNAEHISCHSERSEESKVHWFKKFVRFFAPLRMTPENSPCHSERSEESNRYFTKYLQNKAYKTLFENAEQIIINNIAFFPKPLCIIDQIVKQKKGNQKVIFVVNDYFSICPSFFLLNNKGKYCNIPEIEVCGQCLKKNNLDYIVNIDRDIEKWRNTWQQFLTDCDEIRVFSESSADLLKKAYPSISNKIVKIKPNYSSIFANQ